MMKSPLRSVPLATSGDLHPGLILVQRFLVRFGYLERGAFRAATVDAETAAALRKYQARQGLDVSGDFDEPTRDLVATPRCALPDLHHGLARSTRCTWPTWSLTYRFGGVTTDVSGAIGAVQRAVDTWAATVPVDLTEVAAGADVVIEWQPADCNDYDMRGESVLAGHADYPLGCREIPPLAALPLPVHLNDDLKWCDGTVQDEFDIETAALHELGHVLGLEHHGSAGDVMYATLTPQFENRSLRPTDLTQVRSLYPTEDGWRACQACMGLFWTGAGSAVCPAGAAHDPTGSPNHHITRNLIVNPHIGWQAGWRRCGACAVLFLSAAAGSACPAGGAHNSGGSADYSLLAVVSSSPGRQANWRQCRLCQGLFFAGAAGSVCPAGVTHDRTGSADYGLIFR